MDYIAGEAPKCWCCQKALNVKATDLLAFKPYICQGCFEGKHEKAESDSDDFKCSVWCKECKLTRITFVYRKAAHELFKNRSRIKCKECKKMEVELLIALNNDGGKYIEEARPKTNGGLHPILPAEEWRDKKP